MSISHQQWVHLGDVADTVHDWAVTAAGVLVAAALGASIGFTTFLLLLSKIGNL